MELFPRKLIRLDLMLRDIELTSIPSDILIFTWKGDKNALTSRMRQKKYEIYDKADNLLGQKNAKNTKSLP